MAGVLNTEIYDFVVSHDQLSESLLIINAVMVAIGREIHHSTSIPARYVSHKITQGDVVYT